MVYPDELDLLLNKKMAIRVKIQSNCSQASVHKLEIDESFINQIENDYIVGEHSMSTRRESESDFNRALTLVKVDSEITRDVDVDCDVVGATQYSGIKPPKKVKIEPNN
ncbi:hypothetical protein RYX36_025060 [Vicia faba]